ncbi:PucR family transcriptional regulator [Halalkalibacter okhensis]|uniref:PucR family transcriptional regulator n=1 Tax=Halalkalibacter okhensis TaxID=333138 RepID=A0A0B0IA98_9BACI|nr:PucR family transcriptional regulator [Halalkalibacter okhensis]KHF39463.1 hypothetical protein LQ50_15525 [Halalkalibacter okhensis]
MGSTLNKLLKVGGLRHCKVVSGHSGLSRTISYVTVMEVPDIINWLKGNELLLSSLYPIKDNLNAQAELIDRLHEVGTGALAIKANRFIGSVPEIMIKKSEQYGLPIIVIPEEVSYLDILTPAMNTIFNEKVILQEDLDQASSLLSEITLSENGISQFLETLSTLIKNKVFLESLVPYIEVPIKKSLFEPLTNQQIIELELVGRAVRMPRVIEGELVESCIVSPILLEGKLFGCITSFGFNEYIEIELAILEKASKLLSLDFLRKKVRYEIEQQYRNDFFRDLFFNQFVNKQDLVEKGKIYGFKENDEYVCISVSGQSIKNGELFTENMLRIESGLERIDNEVIIGSVRHSLYILFPVKTRSKQELMQVIKEISKEIKLILRVDVYLGIGRTYQGVDGLRKSFREAEQAVTFGPVFWKDQLIFYFNQIGLYGLIALVEGREELMQFFNETIGELVSNEKPGELDLIETIEQYFKCNESLTATANHLFIHVNTLKYRLQKIKLITGLSLQNTEEKIMLNMGLKIHHFLNSDYRFR